MLTGREKAKVLLEFLGSNATRVLAHLQPHYAQALTSSIEDAPDVSQQDLNALIGEVLENRLRFQTLNANQVGVNVERIAPHQDYQPQEDVYQGISNLGSDDSDSLLIAGASSSYEEPEIPEVDPRIVKMARILSKQRPNMIAFFLHYLEEPDKSLIWDELPLNLQRSAGAVEVENVPASKVMFEKLYNMFINDPDFENNSIAEPKGLETGEEALFERQEHDDVLQGAVDLLSGALENGLGYSGHEEFDEDDDDEEEDEDEDAQDAPQEKYADQVAAKAPIKASVKEVEPAAMNTLSLSEGSESLSFPDLNMEIIGSEIDSAFAYDEPAQSAPLETAIPKPRPSGTNRTASSGSVFDEDLLGPDF
jgi:hypothetical protein